MNDVSGSFNREPVDDDGQPLTPTDSVWVDIPTLRARCQALPRKLRDARRWLVYGDDPDTGRAKCPFYPSGVKRNGTLDSPDDVRRMGTLEQALATYEQHPDTYQGIGFALGPDGTGHRWQGIDGDALNGEHAALLPLFEGQETYCETSPSGNGRHLLGYGQPFESAKGGGLEVYSSGRYFTVSGLRVGACTELLDLGTYVEAEIRPRIEAAKAAARASKAASKASKPRPTAAAPAVSPLGGEDLAALRERLAAARVTRLGVERLCSGVTEHESQSEWMLALSSSLRQTGFTQDETAALIPLIIAERMTAEPGRQKAGGAPYWHETDDRQLRRAWEQAYDRGDGTPAGGDPDAWLAAFEVALVKVFGSGLGDDVRAEWQRIAGMPAGARDTAEHQLAAAVGLGLKAFRTNLARLMRALRDAQKAASTAQVAAAAPPGGAGAGGGGVRPEVAGAPWTADPRPLLGRAFAGYGFPPDPLNGGAPRLDLAHAELARSLMGVLRAVSRGGDDADPVFTDGKFYLCDDTGIWCGVAPEALEQPLGEGWRDQKLCRTKTAYTAVTRLAAQELTVEDFFSTATVGVATPAGFHRITPAGTLEVEPVTPAHRVRYALTFDPSDVEPPEWSAFSGRTFAPNDTYTQGQQAEQVALLHEVHGAMLTGLGARLERAVFFFGVERAGKGLLSDCQKALLPPSALAAVSPMLWDQVYFAAAMAGVLVNQVGELSRDAPLPVAQFKTVIGRDLVTGRNPFGRPFNFKNSATHIITSNTFPYVKERDRAFWDRWVCLHFTNSVPVEDRDPTLKDSLPQQVAPYLLHAALEGAARLARRGRYPETAAHRRVLSLWQDSSSALAEFLADDGWCRLVPAAPWTERTTDGTWVVHDRRPREPRAAFYKRFALWCQENGHHAPTSQKVFDEIERSSPGGVRMTRDGKGRYVEGVKLVTWDVAHVFQVIPEWM